MSTNGHHCNVDLEAGSSTTHDAPCIRLGHYVLRETIGSGTFAKVKVGIHEKSGRKVAVKILGRQKMRKLDVVAKVKREIQTLTKLEHPHITKLYQVITTPTDLFLIMEFVGGGEMFDHIVKRGRLDVDEARRFFQQIISAMDYCHRQNVVHRDLKPENILLDKELNVKIVDFGLSNILSDGDFLRTSCGSPNYAAPEVVSGKLYAGPEVDIWSCGVMLYAFLTGRLPFDDDDIPTLFKRIRTGLFHIPDYMERSVVSLIRHMLQVDPIKRATIKDIIEHEWFKLKLPAYLFPPLDDQSTDFSLLDPSIVAQVAQLYSCDEFEVLTALQESSDPREPMRIAYNMLKSKSEYIFNKNGYDERPSARTPKQRSKTSEETVLPMPLGARRHSMPPSMTRRRPTRCICIPPGAKFCRPDCDLCPKLGASECLFGKKLPSLQSCDLCDKYGQPGCVWANDSPDAMSIEDVHPGSLSPPKARFGNQSSPPRVQIAVQRSAHPERINSAVPWTASLEPVDFKGVSTYQIQKLKNMQRARWHLGIRSQSRPMDIMREIYRAMKSLEMEWKVLDPYHVILRHKCSKVDNSAIKVCLQLYQVDKKSFLLDFKNLTDEVDDQGNGLDQAHASGSSNSMDISGPEKAQSEMMDTSAPLPPSQALLFFETCASIIKVLARV